MKRQIQYLSVTLIIIVFNICAYAQAPPSISYPQPSYTLVTGTNIATTFGTNIIPTNTGGAVANAFYLAVTTPVTAGNVNNPQGLTSDGAGNLYETDQGGDVINKIVIATGVVTPFVGNGTPGERNGTGTTGGGAPEFNNPSGIVYDGAGNLYVTDNTGNTIRKIVIATRVVSTLAGSGTAGEGNANGLAATFNGPAGITYDPTGKILYVADNGGNTIRKINTVTLAVTTLATSGTVGKPAGIVYDGSANLYVTDNTGNTIRKVTTAGVVSTFAGSGTAGATDGTGTGATFSAPWGITIDAVGNLYVADEGNNIIRKITATGAVVTTIAGDGNQADNDGTGTAAEFFSPYSIVADNTGNLFVGDDAFFTFGRRNFNFGTVRQIPLSGYTISPTLPANLAFDGTGTISGKSTSGFAPTVFTVAAYNLSGSSSTTVTLTCGQTINWIGTATGAGNNIRWDKTGNWDSGTVPTGGDDVMIGVTKTFTGAPTINTNTGSEEVGSITFGNKQTVTLTITTRDLQVDKGIIVNAGAVTTITGSGSLTMAPTSTLTFITTGKLNISTGVFTLESDSTGSAAIGPVLTPANFTGTSLSAASVQRYLQGGINERSYRLMSSPVYVSGTTPHRYNLAYIEASAVTTGITGTGGGFDKSGNPTLFLFREDTPPSGAFFGAGDSPGVGKINNATSYNLQINNATNTGLVGTNYNLAAGSGFLFFFRGDKGIFGTTPAQIAQAVAAETLLSYVPTNTIFTSTGALNIGPITATVWYNTNSTTLGFSGTGAGTNSAVRGYNLVGNPYACSIDWDTFSSGGITGTNLKGTAVGNATMYVLDPITRTFGSYTSGSGVGSTSFATNIIVSGQGFFVRATAATGATLTFNESAKLVTAQNIGSQLLMARHTVQPVQPQYLRLQFFSDSVNSEQTTIRFVSQGATNTTLYNALHMGGSGGVSFFSLSADNENMGINTAKLPGTQSTVIGLNVNATNNGTYIVKIRDRVAIPKLYDIWLMDAYKKDSVNLSVTNSYSVDVNKTDSASFGANRLSLVIRQNAALAYRLLDFTASKTQTGRNVEVQWKTENEETYTNFTVERSTNNGRSFDVLGSVKSDGSGSYSFVDKNPDYQRNFYRLKQQDLNNNITYSKVVEVQLNPYAWDKLRIFPNPATHTINLHIDERYDQKGYYDIRFMNSSGLVVRQIKSSQPDWQGNISNLLPGSYLVRVVNTKTQSLVGESKFVKL